MKPFALFALALLSLPFTSAFAAKADKDSDKIVIAFAQPGQEAEDCKISVKEISKFNPQEKGEKYICSQISVLSKDKKEMLPSALAELVRRSEAGAGLLTVSFAGKTEQQLMKTFATWLQFLAATVNEADASGWQATLVSLNGEAAVVRFDNSQSGSNFAVSVEMNKKIKKDKKDKKDKDEDEE